jgi:predicted GNAT family acetyltransferase
MDERYGRVSTGRDFAAPLDDPACACRLYTANGLAQIDEVGTLERRRNEGHATAAVLAAAETAAAEGCDPVFLLTDAADWPQGWYGRLGFRPIGWLYEFLKLPLGSSPP